MIQHVIHVALKVSCSRVIFLNTVDNRILSLTYLNSPVFILNIFFCCITNFLFGCYLSDPYMHPVKVEAGGNSHVFDPPSVDYYDQIYRRGTDLYDSLQLDWVYLFISQILSSLYNVLRFTQTDTVVMCDRFSN